MLVANVTLEPNIFSPKVTKPLQKRFRRIGASAVRASENSLIIANRKSSTRFPTSYRWSPYGTPYSPKGWLKKQICRLKQILFISVIYEASDFKFGTQLGWVCQGPLSNSTRRKVSVYMLVANRSALGQLPEICGFLFNISTTADASDFKFGTQLGFAKAHHQITPIGKVGMALARRAPQMFVVPLQYLHNGEARDFKFKAHHKTTPRENLWAWPCAREAAPIHVGFPFNIFATAALSS